MLRSFAELFRHISEIWARVGINQKIAIALSGVGLTAALFFWSDYSARTSFVPLYPGTLSMENAGQIMQALRAKGVPVKIASDGSTVMVPDDMAVELQLELLIENDLPNDAGGFDSFFKDQTFIGLDENAHRIKVKRATQHDLEKAITALAPIASATVMVVIPETSWITGNENKSTASVQLRLRGGAKLSRQQVDGIARFVAGGVPSLIPENVTILDSNGISLTRPAEDSAGYYSDREQAKKAELERNIRNALEPVLGPGKVKAQVTVKLANKPASTTKALMSSSQPIKSEMTKTITTTNASTGGDPDISTLSGSGSSSGKTILVESTVETEYHPFDSLGQTTTTESGDEIERLTASVTLEAGTWETDAEGKRTYTEAEKTVLDTYMMVVKAAIGFDPDRDEDTNIVLLDRAFWTPTPIPEPAFDIVGTIQDEVVPGLIKHGPVMFMLVAFVFFARKAMRKMESVELPLTAGTTVAEATAMVQGQPAPLDGAFGGDAFAQGSLGPEPMGDDMGLPPAEPAMQQPQQMEPVQQMNPEATADTLRSWMNE